MDRPLSPETELQIRELCESIALRDHLDKDVQEELRGHIEDKVIAYLEGREALTERDAVILAREHFGDPSAQTSHWHSAYPPRVNIDIVRKVAQLVFISYAIQIPAVVVLRTYLNGNPFAAFRADLAPLVISAGPMLLTSGFVVLAVACVLIVLRSSRLFERLDRVPAPTVVTCAVVSFVAFACLPTWWRVEQIATKDGLMTLFGVHMALSLVSCFTWLWWVDNFRGKLANVAAAGCAWLGAIMLHPIAARVVRVAGRVVYGENYMDAYSGTLGTFAIHPFTSFQFGLNGSGLTILYMLLACVVYGAFVRRGRTTHADVALAE